MSTGPMSSPVRCDCTASSPRAWGQFTWDPVTRSRGREGTEPHEGCSRETRPGPTHEHYSVLATRGTSASGGDVRAAPGAVTPLWVPRLPGAPAPHPQSL